MNIVNSRLTELINSFTKKDIKEFKKLVRSPLYAKGRNYIPVLNELIKIKKRKLKEISPQKLYTSVYPGKKFNSQTLKNRLSELFKLGEEFIIYKTIKENSLEKQKILLKAYLKDKNSKHYELNFHSVEKLLSRLPENDMKFLNTLQIQRQHIEYLKTPEISDYAFNQYFEFSSYTVFVFLIILFEFGIEYLQQEQTERKYEFNIVKEILERLKVDDIMESMKNKNSVTTNLVLMQYFFYNAFKNPDEEKNYFKARKLFDEIRDNLNEDYKIQQYNIMTYYCIIRHNYGIKKFQIELFKLYNERLKLGIYLDIEKKYFPVRTFRNYVLLGIILKKHKWTENFIKKYSRELTEDYREYEIRLSYSRLYFSKKEYSRSLGYLENFKGLNYLHYCDSSVLKLCNYYEAEKFEDAFFEIDKFTHYLRNHKEIPKIHKIYSLNFLKIYLKIIKIKTGTEKKNLLDLENLFEKTELISRKNWLKEKIDELK